MKLAITTTSNIQQKKIPLSTPTKHSLTNLRAQIKHRRKTPKFS
jgi:hypothetical protein